MRRLDCDSGSMKMQEETTKSIKTNNCNYFIIGIFCKHLYLVAFFIEEIPIFNFTVFKINFQYNKTFVASHTVPQ